MPAKLGSVNISSRLLFVEISWLHKLLLYMTIVTVIPSSISLLITLMLIQPLPVLRASKFSTLVLLMRDVIIIIIIIMIITIYSHFQHAMYILFQT